MESKPCAGHAAKLLQTQQLARATASSHRLIVAVFCIAVWLSRFVDVDMYKNVHGGLVVSSRWKLLGWV